MTETEQSRIEVAARAIQNAAEKFEGPVRLYVEREARRRWERENPDKDSFTDMPDSIDWDLESWKILARAALGLPDTPPLKIENCDFSHASFPVERMRDDIP